MKRKRAKSVSVTDHAIDMWRERVAVSACAMVDEVIEAVQNSVVVAEDEFLPLSIRRDLSMHYYYNKQHNVYFIVQPVDINVIRVVTVIDPNQKRNCVLPKTSYSSGKSSERESVDLRLQPDALEGDEAQKWRLNEFNRLKNILQSRNKAEIENFSDVIDCYNYLNEKINRYKIEKKCPAPKETPKFDSWEQEFKWKKKELGRLKQILCQCNRSELAYFDAIIERVNSLTPEVNELEGKKLMALWRKKFANKEEVKKEE